MKECIVVLGMHRSGTSVLSGLVSLQGFYLGSEVMPVREDNPKGFFENMKVYRLNQSILEAHDTSWDNHFFTYEQISPDTAYKYELEAKRIIKEEFGLVSKIFIKDPRMCLLFPLWEKVLTDLGYKIKVILAYRGPMEVALSLKSRNNLETEKSLMLWSHYFFQAEKTSRGYERLVVKYSDDFRDLDTFFKTLGLFLGVNITPEMNAAAHDLYTPTLKHHQLQLDNLSSETPSYLKKFIAILQAEEFEQTENLDDVIDDFYHSKQFFLYNDKHQVETIAGLEEKLTTLAKELRTVEASLKASAEAAKNNSDKAEERLNKVSTSLEKELSEAKRALLKVQNETHEKLLTIQNESKQRLHKTENEAEQKLKISKRENEQRLLKVEEEAKQKLIISRREDEQRLLKIEEEAKQKLIISKRENEQRLIEIEEEAKKRLKKTKKQAKVKLLAREQAAKKDQDRLAQEIKLIASTSEAALEGAKANANKIIEKTQQTLKQTADKLSSKTKEAKQLNDKKESIQRQHKKLQEEIKQHKEKLLLGEAIFNKVCTDTSLHRQLVRTFIKGGYKPKSRLNIFAKKGNNKSLKEKALISSSGLFSPFYYLTNNPDVWQNNVNPLNHFCNEGWKEGRNPSPQFNTRDYLALNSDVADAGINPLVHYIQYGKKEGRHPSLESKNALIKSNQKQSPRATNTKALTPLKPQHSGKTRSEIDTFDVGIATGWFLSNNCLPILKINGIPAKCLEFSSPDQETNFTFQSISSTHNDTTLELLSLNEQGITTTSKKTVRKNSYLLDKYADVEKAYQLCKDPKSVAITVWEGAHNPIGRAKVLYDVVSTQRPVVIFAYVFGSFGKDLWAPIKTSGMNIVLIPYEERLAYQQYMQDRGVKFNTVWICKHRLHSFELASMISRPATACILDMDDNEDVFVSSKGSELKPYGIFSKNKANYFLGKVPVRSVASISLQDNYGGMLLRHARKRHKLDTTKAKTASTLTAVFIGTIRPHKNITELVAAITRFNDTSGIELMLAIGGDFDPPSMRESLNTPHTTILDDISNEDLFNTLAQYDVLITGFPDEGTGNKEINKYQITSKIGDGLATGKPVLTPYSPAVDDLQKTPGLFVFTPNDFNLQLKRAIAYKEKISLPDEFTLDHSYKTFSKLENLAKKESQAKNVFAMEPFYGCRSSDQVDKQNIVLVWKQHDAGIYGRRIDIIARYYKQRNPECNVTVIEAVSERQLNHMMSSRMQFDNSTLITNETLSLKLYQYSVEGVDYRLISYGEASGWNSFEDQFNGFLNAARIYPHNSVMILFPLHQVFDQLMSTLKNYKLIIDLVDNQIKWITTPEGRLKGLKQYYELISIADEVVANSPLNIAYFEDLNFFIQSTPHFISNWYTLPKSVGFKREVMDSSEINLVYSGNLNDRIDWELFAKICEILAKHNGKLHIAGSTIRRSEEMKALLEQPNCIYHGVVNETQLLRLIQHMDFAVIPHIEDKISKFMDPIKLKMYKKLGLVSLSTKLPGLPENDPSIVVTESQNDFLSKLETMLANCKTFEALSINETFQDEVGEMYSLLIDKLANNERK